METKHALIQQKALLAKLLANENVTVVHEAIPTAWFDLEKRVVHLPVLSGNISPELYDLLEAHEVSHGLNTPAKGWHNALEKDPKFKHYLNVCEDVRIERLIKERYPGLRRSFAIGYRELHEMDFFGVRRLCNPNNLSFIDRINLFYKVGALMNIQFSTAEQKVLKQLDAAETFDAIERVARSIYKAAKDESKQNKQVIKNLTDLLEQMSQQSGDGQSSDEGEQSESGDAGDESEQSDDSGDQDGDAGDEGEQSDDSGDQDDQDDQSSDGDGDAEGEAPDSVTDQSFRARERELADQDTSTIATANFPQPDPSTFLEPLEAVLRKFNSQITPNDRQRATTALKDIKAQNRSMVQQLVNEFNQRKNATQLAREQTWRSGELDTRKLARYKLSDDLFRRFTETPKGKSHGMVMFLDFSGSMAGANIHGAVQQTLMLIEFCSLLGIPYDVYGFGDRAFVGDHPSRRDWGAPADLKTNNRAYIIQLASSRASTELRKQAMEMMALMMVVDDHPLTNCFGATPLLEAIICSRQLIDQFKSTTRVDIVNVVYMTDGDGTSHLQDYSARVLLIDPITHYQMLIKGTYGVALQNALVEFVQHITGCRHIGFYICSKTDVSKVARDHGLPKPEFGYAVVTRQGFDAYYYLDIRFLGQHALSLRARDTAKSEFVDLVTRQTGRRAVLRAFAQQIANRL